jgi:ABC-2 type transport system ATP-binding protein
VSTVRGKDERRQRVDLVTPTAPAALEVHGVSRTFGAKQALRDVSLAVLPGEIHAVLGPNGAGKTTLMRIIVGLTAPDEGSVSIQGQPTQDPRSRQERRRVQMVPSGDRTLYLRISGIENLAFFGRLAGLTRRDALDVARGRLAAVGLADAAKQRVHTYSHGMQKRLSIARALLTEPPILVFDEATHDLDPAGARTILELVREAATQGTAVIWTTQRVEEIRGFCDRVTLIHEGTTRFAGSVPDLIARGAGRRYLIQLRATGDLDPLASVTGTLPFGVVLERPDDGSPDQFRLSLGAEVSVGHVVAAIVDAGVEVVSCTLEGSEIEDAFLRLTGGHPDGG